jgi:hypothetical protein
MANVPFDLGVNRELRTNHYATLWIAAMGKCDCVDVARLRVLLDLHGIQIGQHRDRRQAVDLLSGVVEEHVEGRKVALAIMPPSGVEARREAGVHVVFEGQTAEIAHRQIAVRIDRVRRKPAHVTRRAQHPDRGNLQSARRHCCRCSRTRPADDQ